VGPHNEQLEAAVREESFREQRKKRKVVNPRVFEQQQQRNRKQGRQGEGPEQDGAGSSAQRNRAEGGGGGARYRAAKGDAGRPQQQGSGTSGAAPEDGETGQGWVTVQQYLDTSALQYEGGKWLTPWKEFYGAPPHRA
jgi:hypothetical protein